MNLSTFFFISDKFCWFLPSFDLSKSSIYSTQQYLFDSILFIRLNSICLTQFYLFDSTVFVRLNSICSTQFYLFNSTYLFGSTLFVSWAWH